MGTKLLRFSYNNEILWGVLEDELRVVAHAATSLKELLTSGKNEIIAAKTTGEIIAQDDITLLSPVTSDANIYCQGTNYSVHRVEAGYSKQKPPYNLLFTKASSTLNSANADIICPAHVQLLDYEIELGLVIGQNISEPTMVTDATLENYVAGFVITNDVSARDVQIVEQQWFKGKSYRGFCPVGPFVYLLEDGEIDYLEKLELHLQVNGETRQQVLTDQLLFKPTETLSEMSEIFDLNIGDLVLTGTPGGVALRLNADIINHIYDNTLAHDEKTAYFVDSQKEGTYLKAGDVMTLSIKSTDGQLDLGTQENKILQAVAVD